MNESKKSLLGSLACIIIAILLIVWGGTVAFTLACLLFAASGALHHKSIVENDLEQFQEQIAAGVISTEEAGETSTATVDLSDISESDKETLERLFGMTFEIEEETKDDRERY